MSHQVVIPGHSSEQTNKRYLSYTDIESTEVDHHKKLKRTNSDQKQLATPVYNAGRDMVRFEEMDKGVDIKSLVMDLKNLSGYAPMPADVYVYLGLVGSEFPKEEGPVETDAEIVEKGRKYLLEEMTHNRGLYADISQYDPALTYKWTDLLDTEKMRENFTTVKRVAGNSRVCIYGMGPALLKTNIRAPPPSTKVLDMPYDVSGNHSFISQLYNPCVHPVSVAFHLDDYSACEILELRDRKLSPYIPGNTHGVRHNNNTYVEAGFEKYESALGSFRLSEPFEVDSEDGW